MPDRLIYFNISGLGYDGPYYLRTNDGYELDLIFGLSGVTYAVEIKLSTSPGKGDQERLEKAANLIGVKKIWNQPQLRCCKRPLNWK